MTFQEIISNVQMETESGSEPRLKPEDWLRWAFDGATEAFLLDGACRIQADMTVLPVPFTVSPDADPEAVPNPYEIPLALQPFRTGLEAYIRFRYHSTNPKNADEKAAASAAYQEFLRAFGVHAATPAA